MVGTGVGIDVVGTGVAVGMAVGVGVACGGVLIQPEIINDDTIAINAKLTLPLIIINLQR